MWKRTSLLRRAIWFVQTVLAVCPSAPDLALLSTSITAVFPVTAIRLPKWSAKEGHRLRRQVLASSDGGAGSDMTRRSDRCSLGYDRAPRQPDCLDRIQSLSLHPRAGGSPLGIFQRRCPRSRYDVPGLQAAGQDPWRSIQARPCRSLSISWAAPSEQLKQGVVMASTAAADEGTFDEALGRRISRAVKDWTGQLVDVSGRNTLLCFKDLKAGTLDLSTARDVSLERILAGHTVRFSDAFDRRRPTPRCASGTGNQGPGRGELRRAGPSDTLPGVGNGDLDQ